MSILGSLRLTLLSVEMIRNKIIQRIARKYQTILWLRSVICGELDNHPGFPAFRRKIENSTTKKTIRKPMAIRTVFPEWIKIQPVIIDDGHEKTNRFDAGKAACSEIQPPASQIDKKDDGSHSKQQ